MQYYVLLVLSRGHKEKPTIHSELFTFTLIHLFIHEIWKTSDTPRAYIDLCSIMSSIAFNEWLGICRRKKEKQAQRNLSH